MKSITIFRLQLQVQRELPLWLIIVMKVYNGCILNNSYRKIQQNAKVYQNLLLHINIKLNMFRATHYPSSGAVSVQQLHVQQPSTYAKPEAASAVLGS
jgi:methionine salvage enolase-phosphatase E1